MIKVTFLLAFMLLAITFVVGQSPATKTATTSVDIIIPIGAGKSGDFTIDNFYPGNAAGSIEVKKDMIMVNGKLCIKDLDGKVKTPSFHVASGQSTYSITIAFDPIIVNRNTLKETMFIEVLTILPISENKPALYDTDEFSIGAKLRLDSLQTSGQYFSPVPYKVTIHFN